ncbi:tape measure protein, partial [Enterobacter roggenkampii]
STRSYGVSVEDIARLTTIINQGFVISGASAEEASNAIIQLAQGLASGALRGDEFNSVNEQGNRLMIALADSMNVSIGALRNMAAEGKLTTDVIVNGLLSQGDKIGQEFAKTTATISQSLEIANNNITKFFGENATVKTGVKIFSDSVISLSENLDVLSTTLTIVAGVMGSRYVGALTMATSAKIADIAASRQQVAADNQTAQAALVAANSVQRKALADKEAALSSLALAQAEYNVAKGSAAEMLAMDALVAAKTRATNASLALAEAETAQAAASARAATAARAASIGIGMARGALALIGGPAGAAMLAAGAIFYFWQKAQQAKEEAIAFADGLDKLNAAMNAMSNTQLRGAIADANNSIRAQKEAVADLQSEVDSLRDRYQNFTPAAQKVAESMGQGTDFARQQAEVSDELARKTRDLEAAKDKLSRTEETASEATRTLTNNMLTAMGVHDQLIEKSWSLEQVQGAVAKAFGETADEINRANQAGKSFDPKALQISPATKEGDKVIATLEEQNELLKIQDERARAIAKARMQAARVTDNQNQISAAGRLAAENYDLEKSEEARKKAQQESEQQGKKSASSAESVAQKLDKLRAQSDLTTESIEKRRIQEAGLRAEQSLGSAATQQQLDEAKALGEANERAAISIQKRKEAEQGQKYAKQEIAAGSTSVNPITGFADNPLAQINLQETQKLEALAKYQELDKENTQLYEDAKTAIQLQASNARMQIAQTEADQQRASVLSILGSASQGFDSLASVIENSAGKSNAAYQVMFAASKAFAIAQSTLSLNTAIMQAMADPTALTPAQKLANYAAIASAGASLLSNVASISYGGGREHGGPVSASSMYRVGEGGKPEIYQANNGSQYMIPGDNGRVISNRDMQGGGSGGSSFNPVMNLVINTTGGVGDEEIARLRKAWNNDMLKMMVDQSTRPGGLLQGRRKS